MFLVHQNASNDFVGSLFSTLEVNFRGQRKYHSQHAGVYTGVKLPQKYSDVSLTMNLVMNLKRSFWGEASLIGEILYRVQQSDWNTLNYA